MANAKKSELEDSVPVLEDEDQETLAAIDEGIREAEAGRTVPAEEVRKLLPKFRTVHLLSLLSKLSKLSCKT